MKAWFGPNIFREMPAIFLAAVVLGTTYNRSSPLGVSLAGSGASTPIAGLAIKTITPSDSLPSAESDPALQPQITGCHVLGRSKALAGEK